MFTHFFEALEKFEKTLLSKTPFMLRIYDFRRQMLCIVLLGYILSFLYDQILMKDTDAHEI